MRKRRGRFHAKKSGGFSLIEALVGMAMIGIAMLGLAQLLLLSVSNNTRAGEISRGAFLAQQELDYLRALTDAELSAFPTATRGESADEAIDVNGDGSTDFRRISLVAASGSGFSVKILVFPATAVGKTSTALLAAPSAFKARAVISSVIIR